MSEGWNNGYRTGLCRFCATEQPGIEIFSSLGQEQNLFIKIQLCHLPFEITMADTLPTFICYPCNKKLNTFHDFYNTAIGIQMKLKEICTVPVTKEEKSKVVEAEDEMKIAPSKELKLEVTPQKFCTIDLSLEDEDEKQQRPVSPKRQKLLTTMSSGQSSIERTGLATPPKSNPSVCSLAEWSISNLPTSHKKVMDIEDEMKKVSPSKDLKPEVTPPKIFTIDLSLEDEEEKLVKPVSPKRQKLKVVEAEDEMKIVPSKELKPEVTPQKFCTIDLSLEDEEEKQQRPVSPKRQKLLTTMSSGQSSIERTGLATPPKSNPSVCSLAEWSISNLPTSHKKVVEAEDEMKIVPSKELKPEVTPQKFCTIDLSLEDEEEKQQRPVSPKRQKLLTTMSSGQSSIERTGLATPPKSNPSVCSLAEWSISNLPTSHKISSTNPSGNQGSSVSNWVPPRGITVIKKGLSYHEKSNSSKTLEGKASEMTILGTIDITGPKETDEEVLTIDITDSTPSNLQNTHQRELSKVDTLSGKPPQCWPQVSNGYDTTNSVNDIMSECSEDSDATLPLDQSPPRPTFTKQVGRTSVPRSGGPS